MGYRDNSLGTEIRQFIEYLFFFTTSNLYSFSGN